MTAFGQCLVGDLKLLLMQWIISYSQSLPCLSSASTSLQVCKSHPSCLLLATFYSIAVFVFCMDSCEDSNVIFSYKTYLSIFLNNERFFIRYISGVLLVLSEMYEQCPLHPCCMEGDLNVDACEHRMRQT